MTDTRTPLTPQQIVNLRRRRPHVLEVAVLCDSHEELRSERDAISQQAQAHAQARELEQKDCQAALLRERGHLERLKHAGEIATRYADGADGCVQAHSLARQIEVALAADPPASSAVTGEPEPVETRLDSSHDWREVKTTGGACALLQCWRCMIIAGESGADERCPLNWTAQPPSAAPVETPPIRREQLAAALTWEVLVRANEAFAIRSVAGDGFWRADADARNVLVDAILAALTPQKDQE